MTLDQHRGRWMVKQTTTLIIGSLVLGAPAKQTQHCLEQPSTGSEIAMRFTYKMWVHFYLQYKCLIL